MEQQMKLSGQTFHLSAEGSIRPQNVWSGYKAKAKTVGKALTTRLVVYGSTLYQPCKHD